MKEENFRILIVDDHEIVRYGMTKLLEKQEGLEVIGEAGSLKEAYEKIEESKPDIILLDMKLPDGNGAEACREIKKRYKDIKIIILTAFADDSIMTEAVMAGAEGYLLKDIDSKNIVSRIWDVALNKLGLDKEVLDKVFNQLSKNEDKGIKLTSQEKDMLELISQGKTNREIGEDLFIAEKTVRNNLVGLFKKIKVGNRTEAAIYWMKEKHDK